MTKSSASSSAAVSTTKDLFDQAQVLLSGRKFREAKAVLDQIPMGPETRDQIRLGTTAALIGDGKHQAALDYIWSSGGLDTPELVINAAVSQRVLHGTDAEYDVLKDLIRFSKIGLYDSYLQLANAAVGRKDWLVAFLATAQARLAKPENRDLIRNLATFASHAGRHADVVFYGKRFLEFNGTDTDTRAAMASMIAGAYKDMAQLGQSMKYAKESVELIPNSGLHSNLIMSMQYAHGIRTSDYLAETHRYERIHCNDTRLPYVSPDRLKKSLRIGFVSGDFIGHSLASLLLDIFNNFKKVAPQHIYDIYFTRAPEAKDVVSGHYKSCTDNWYDIRGMSPAAIAELVRANGTDVLVDLSGHTAENVLPAFGLRPAPCQIGWVSGMMSPPGLDSIPYFLADKDMISEGHGWGHGLELVPSAYLYSPLADAPDIDPEPPQVRNGYVTFGSLNNPCKLNSSVIETWLQVLKAVPKSQLHIKVYSDITTTMIRECAAAASIEQFRIVIIGNLPRTEDVMAYYNNRIDVALDTWPCAGMLTSLEAMWMGSPVVTLAGPDFLHNQTVSVLRKIQLPELIATDPKGFVATAARYGTDPKWLQQFRSTIRGRYAGSLIRNPTATTRGIVRGIENCYSMTCSTDSMARELDLRAYELAP